MAIKKGTKNRAYLTSHPWLTFNLDLSKTGYLLWMHLGAAQSKCEHVANAMLPPDTAQKLYVLYLAKGVQATTAIEGNTLTEEQVRERILEKKPLPKSQEYQGQEVDNLVAACAEISEKIIEGGECFLSVDSIVNYNAIVLNKLPLEDPDIVPGAIRSYSVTVGRYRGAPPEDCRYLLQEMCTWINDKLQPPDVSQKISFGILRAIAAHVYLAWIHPFGDGNGRTARLLEYQLLLGAGVPAVAAHLLSNHYNKTRSEYYRHLDIARQSIVPFMEYAAQGFVDQLDEQIKFIRQHQRSIAWKDYVYDKFKGQKTIAANRQRQLALALGLKSSPVSIARISLLTTELAAEYAKKTRKTIARDINSLRRMGLVVKLGGSRVIANKYKLQSFLPKRRDKDKWM